MINQAIKLMPYKSRFESIFKLPLRKYVSPFLGFDVIKFDADLKTPDGISTADFIEKKYGEEAKRLIVCMMGLK